MARFDLTDGEWSLIQPVLPQKSRGIPRVDDRRVLNGIFWVLRSGAPWADMPDRYGPVTTCYNRFRRWTKAGVWDRIMDAITDAYGDDIKMIDGTSVRVHHAAATLKKVTRIVVWGEAEAVLQRKSMLSSTAAACRCG
jgi:transposase